MTPKLRACLQGVRVHLASGLTLAGGAKVLSKISQARKSYNLGKPIARLHSKGPETCWVGALTLPEVF